jgi:hypothetical protein
MECPSCHENCDEVYQCNECNTMFCDSCKRDLGVFDAVTLGITGPECPNGCAQGKTVVSDGDSNEEDDDD